MLAYHIFYYISNSSQKKLSPCTDKLKIQFIICLGILLPNLDSKILIDVNSMDMDSCFRKTDSDGKQVVVGVEEDARLFCRTNAPWKKCLWKPPRNGVRQVRL